MRKISYLLLIVIVAIALIVISCGKDEPKQASINPGLYLSNQDIKLNGKLIPMKQQVRYKADGTYEAENFQNNAVVEELKGKYKMENNHLVSFDTQHRFVNQDGKWLQKKDLSKVDIRKIEKESYQYYFKFPDEKSREKYKEFGLSEGWKTYKRISD